ncbi:pyridoxamine 5'-phosphate oxidase family protein [Halarcobacter sp.]|uniref:pyridoxamine 5'-phosphate oxidase family protein n=1 Tax=Halarcobacter sp. TaxID=2321133 RepID=UPI0029F4DAF3|nr:pyridoxamine 5'-phosphate oxidase family protein [Halarcobacter sp.]
MKAQVRIKDKNIIEKLLADVEYGTLALSKNNVPYSLPINFVYSEDNIYFHGAKKGKKIDFMSENSLASFSVVEPFSLIQSYFSSKDNLACPATHFFKSVICDGEIIFVDEYEEKVKALSLLMEKLQPEGKYIPLDDKIYLKMINATEVFKLKINNIEGKLKLGQNLPKDRFNMILEYLENRGYDLDKETITQMKEYR